MDAESFIKDIRTSEDYRGQLAHIARVPPRDAQFGSLAEPLHPSLQQRLTAIGIDRFYTHQAEAINHALGGAHVAVVTSTASGKTLCYNVPVMHTLLTNPRKKALYLFPTKALAQDQIRKLKELSIDGPPRIGIYDGDTSPADRRYVRRNCDVIITNPDMLHLSILPYHSNWADFFHNLAFVVIDEMHTYRGVFGAHTANVMRRLRRVCRHHGSVPQFIGCSATIGNPAELVQGLTGVTVRVVDRDGSPSGEKFMVFWNPPYIGEGERKSANWEAAGLFTKLVERDIRCITFTRARVIAELIYKYARAELMSRQPQLADRIMSYRGGYTPEQRREIERGMFSGRLLGVTATNALELGIDIGDLDACVLTGYPGTISSTWQQAGRAGRGRSSSMAILVGANNPLDQFLMRNPDYLLDRANERAIVDPGNPYILAEHLLCAAYEIPLSEHDYPLFGPDTESILGTLVESGELSRSATRFFWTGSGYPAARVNLRATGGSGFDIHLTADPETSIGTVEESRAFHVLHEGAVYLHLGESYVVDRLDVERQAAYVSPRPVDYYTAPRAFTTIHIEAEHSAKQIGAGTLHLGDIRVDVQVTGYYKRELMNDRTLEIHNLDYPIRTFRTIGMWITFDVRIPDEVTARKLGLEGGLHAAEHALIGMMPLQVTCDRADIGGASHPLHPGTGTPSIFIYDAYPGGAGICENAYDDAEELLHRTLTTIDDCRCNDGCPSCIQSPKCGNGNHPLDKTSAKILLKLLAQ